MLSPLEVGVEDSALYGETEDIDRRFDCELDGMDYDDKFVFDDLGYNLLPSEVSAAFALEQLKSLMKRLIIGCATFII